VLDSNITLTGMSMTGTVSSITIWTEVSSNDTQTWSNINTADSDTWTEVATADSDTWTEIPAG